MDLEEIFFPWIKVIRKKMLKSFPVVKEKTLDILLDYVHDELKNLDLEDTYRAEILYETLSYFHFHFTWKVNWNEESYLLLCCVQLLYYITYVALILSSGNVQSPWLNKAVSTLNFFSDKCEIICDVLLLIRNIPSKYLSAYREILRSALIGANIRKPVDAQCFIKIMLLFRRFKSLIPVDDTDKRTDIYNLASKVTCPVDTMNFLLTANNDDECSFTERNIFKKFLNKNLKGTFIKNLFEVLFRNKYNEKLMNFSANIKRKSKSTTNISVRQNNLKVCRDIKNKLKHKIKKNGAKEEKNDMPVLKKSKRKKKRQKVHSEKELVGSSGTVMPIPVSFSGEQHIKPKVNSHVDNQNWDNFQVQSMEVLSCEKTLSKKLDSKKRAFSTNSDSFADGFVNNLSPSRKNKKRKTSNIVSYENEDSIFKNSNSLSDRNQDSHCSESTQITTIHSESLIFQNKEIHYTNATLNGEVRNFCSKNVLLLNENDSISEKVVSKPIDSNKKDKFITSSSPVISDRPLVSSKLHKHNKNSSPCSIVNDANQIEAETENFAPVDDEKCISNVSESISRNNVENDIQPNDVFKIDVSQNELVHSKICVQTKEDKESVEIKSEIPCDKPLSTSTLIEDNAADYLDINTTCFIRKQDNGKCDNDLKLCSEENIYNTSTPSHTQKSCRTFISYTHKLFDYKHFASPESLDLNVSSVISEYSKEHLLENSRNIYSTTDSSVSLSSELQEIINPKEVKRKKSKKQKLSKSNSKSLSVDEMKNDETGNLNDLSTAGTDEISLEHHTKAMNLNSGLFPKLLPSSDNVSESPDNLKVSVENRKAEMLQTDVKASLEPKVCSLSNENFTDSIKGKLGSKSKDIFSTPCNESDELSTPKCKTSKSVINLKLSLKAENASPLKIHSPESLDLNVSSVTSEYSKEHLLENSRNIYTTTDSSVSLSSEFQEIINPKEVKRKKGEKQKLSNSKSLSIDEMKNDETGNLNDLSTAGTDEISLEHHTKAMKLNSGLFPKLLPSSDNVSESPDNLKVSVENRKAQMLQTDVKASLEPKVCSLSNEDFTDSIKGKLGSKSKDIFSTPCNESDELSTPKCKTSKSVINLKLSLKAENASPLKIHSPESLDLNVSSVTSEYSKEHLLENSRNIYTTTDSSVSLSSEFQEIINPKEVKRKKGEKQKLSNSKSLSIDEMKNDETGNLNDLSTAGTDEISLEHHTKAMKLNSGLFPKLLPSSDNVSESPDNLKVSVENRKAQMLQTDVKASLEPKVCSLSNEDFTDSIKGKLGSKSKDIFSTPCNESDELSTPKCKTSKSVINLKLSLKAENASSLKIHSKGMHDKKAVDLSPNKLPVNRQKEKHKQIQDCKEKLINSVYNENASKIYKEKQQICRKHFADSSSSSENELNTSVNEAIETLDNSIHDIAETYVVSSENSLSKNTNVSEVKIESFPKSSLDMSFLTNANANLNKCFDSKKEDRRCEILLEDKKNMLDQNSTFIKSSTELRKMEFKKINVTIEPTSEISSDSCYELNESNHISEENEFNSDSSDELNVTDRAASFNSSIQIQSKNVHSPESKVKTIKSLKSCSNSSTNSTNSEEECETLQENKDNCRNKESYLASSSIDKNTNSENKKIRQRLIFKFLPKSNQIICNNNEKFATKSPKGSTSLPVLEHSLNSPIKTQLGALQTQTGVITSKLPSSFSAINASQSGNECTNSPIKTQLDALQTQTGVITSKLPSSFSGINASQSSNECTNSPIKTQLDALQTQTGVITSKLPLSFSAINASQSCNEYTTTDKLDKLEQSKKSSPTFSRCSTEFPNLNNKEDMNLKLQNLDDFSDSGSNSKCDENNLNQKLSYNSDQNSNTLPKNMKNATVKKVYKRKKIKSRRKISQSNKDSCDNQNILKKIAQDLCNKNVDPELNCENCDTYPCNFKLTKSSHHTFSKNDPISTEEVHLEEFHTSKLPLSFSAINASQSCNECISTDKLEKSKYSSPTFSRCSTEFPNFNNKEDINLKLQNFNDFPDLGNNLKCGENVLNQTVDSNSDQTSDTLPENMKNVTLKKVYKRKQTKSRRKISPSNKDSCDNQNILKKIAPDLCNKNVDPELNCENCDTYPCNFELTKSSHHTLSKNNLISTEEVHLVLQDKIQNDTTVNENDCGLSTELSCSDHSKSSNSSLVNSMLKNTYETEIENLNSHLSMKSGPLASSNYSSDSNELSNSNKTGMKMHELNLSQKSDTMSLEVYPCKVNELASNDPDVNISQKSDDTMSSEITLCKVSQLASNDSHGISSVHDLSVKENSTSSLQPLVLSDEIQISFSHENTSTPLKRSNSISNFPEVGKNDPKIVLNEMPISSDLRSKSVDLTQPSQITPKNFARNTLTKDLVKVFSPKSPEIGDKFSLRLNNCSIIGKSPFKQNQKSLDFSDLEKNESPNYFIESSQLGENSNCSSNMSPPVSEANLNNSNYSSNMSPPVSEANLNNSNCSSNMSPPIKLSAYQKGKKIISDSDSNSDNTSVKKINKDLTGLEHATQNKSGNEVSNISSCFEKKSKRLASKRERFVTKSHSKNISDDSKNSLNNATPKSDSVISSKKHSLKRNKLSMDNWMKSHGIIDPGSFINFSASEAESDDSDCSPDSELEDFIVSDHVSEVESEQELNDSVSSTKSHCLSKSSFVGRKSQRIRRKRIIIPVSDGDSSDDEKSAISTQKTKLGSKKNKILSESDSDGFCDRNSSDTATKLTTARNGKSRNFRKNKASNFKRKTSCDNNSSNNIKKNLSKNPKYGNSETNRTSFEIGCNTSNDQSLSNNFNAALTVPNKSSSNYLSPKRDSRSSIKHDIRNNSSQSNQSVNNVVQESVSCKLNSNSSHNLPDGMINSKGRKRKYNKSTVSLPSQNPYNLRKRKSRSNLTDTTLQPDKIVSINQSASSNNHAADSDSKRKNSGDTFKNIHPDPVQNSINSNSNKLQVSSVLKVNCGELADPYPLKNKKVLALHSTKKCSTPKKILSSNKVPLNVSDTDSDKTCLLQNASVIEKQTDLVVSEKSDALYRDLHISDDGEKTLTKSPDSLDCSSELSKRSKSEIENSRIIIQKRRTMNSIVNNKKEQCIRFTNNKQNVSKNMKQIQGNSVKEFSSESIIDSWENALPLSITEDKNCGFSIQANKEFSDSFECVSPTQIQKNVLNFYNSCNSFECVSPTQFHNNVLKHSTALDLSKCPTQIPKDNQKNSNSSECASLTHIQKTALKNSCTSDSPACASPIQTQNDDQQNSGNSYEYIPATHIQKNGLEKSNPLALNNFKNFDNYQKEILSNENSCSLINPPKDIVKGNSSAKNLSQSVDGDSQGELDGIKLVGLFKKNKNGEMSENTLLHTQKNIQKDFEKCSVKTIHKNVGNLSQLLKHFTNSDKTVLNLQKNHPSAYSRLFEEHLPSKKGATDLTLKKIQNPPDVFSQNELPCNDLLRGNMENSDHFVTSETDTENLSQEFLVDSGDERLMCSVVDKLENDSTSLISDNFLKNISVDNFIECPFEQNLANNVISSDQHIKPSLLCKDNTILPLKTKDLSSIVNEPHLCSINPLSTSHYSQGLQYVPKANCDVISSKNCIVDTNCSISLPRVDSFNLDTSSDKTCFVNTNYNTLSPQINPLNLDPCIELFQNDELTNSEKSELQSSNSSDLSLDHQLSQMGYEKNELRINQTQNSISECNQTRNVKSCSETAMKSHLKQSISLPQKFVIICDVKEKTYEVCELPEEIPCNTLNKPTVTHSESQTDINDSGENIYKTNKKVNDCSPEEFIIVNGTKLSKSSFDPVVNIGKKCDDIEIKSNNNNKIGTHSSRICQKSEKMTKQSVRKRKNKLCGCPEC